MALKTCCGCAPLRTGVLIIALLEVIGIIFGLIRSQGSVSGIVSFIFVAVCAVLLVYGAFKVIIILIPIFLLRNMIFVNLFSCCF